MLLVIEREGQVNGRKPERAAVDYFFIKAQPKHYATELTILPTSSEMNQRDFLLSPYYQHFAFSVCPRH